MVKTFYFQSKQFGLISDWSSLANFWAPATKIDHANWRHLERYQASIAKFLLNGFIYCFLTSAKKKLGHNISNGSRLRCR